MITSGLVRLLNTDGILGGDDIIVFTGLMSVTIQPSSIRRRDLACSANLGQFKTLMSLIPGQLLTTPESHFATDISHHFELRPRRAA